MNALVKQGKAVLMISSDMPELLSLCDRIYVMKDGKVTQEFPHSRSDTGEAAGVRHLGGDGYETEKTELQSREKLGLLIGVAVLFIIMSILAEGFQLVQHSQPAERR